METQILERYYTKAADMTDGYEVDFDLDNIYPDDIFDKETLLGRDDIRPFVLGNGHINLQAIADGFAVMGTPVSVHALRHNFSAWLGDMKSGYLDRDYGCFVFTPCGCNPLSFRVQRVEGEPKDYQETYEC